MWLWLPVFNLSCISFMPSIHTYTTKHRFGLAKSVFSVYFPSVLIGWDWCILMLLFATWTFGNGFSQHFNWQLSGITWRMSPKHSVLLGPWNSKLQILCPSAVHGSLAFQILLKGDRPDMIWFRTYIICIHIQNVAIQLYVRISYEYDRVLTWFDSV